LKNTIKPWRTIGHARTISSQASAAPVLVECGLIHHGRAKNQCSSPWKLGAKSSKRVSSSMCRARLSQASSLQGFAFCQSKKSVRLSVATRLKKPTSPLLICTNRPFPLLLPVRIERKATMPASVASTD
jgi:hypothetical protein